MKIIDLLNKIANGEEVPEIILFNSYKYRFDKIDKVYRNINGNSTLGAVVELDIYLNDKVKIIKDTPKEEKKMTEKLNKLLYREDYATQNACIDDIIRQFNYLIDYLKNKGE